MIIQMLIYLIGAALALKNPDIDLNELDTHHGPNGSDINPV